MRSELDKYKAQLTRVIHMEELYDRISEALSSGNDAHDKLLELNDEFQELKAYYEGPDWKEDYGAEQNELFPSNLKRGILAEDTLYDLLGDVDQILGGKDEPLKAGDKDEEGNIFLGTFEKEINGTTFIIETFQSKDARETAYDKVKRLILNHANDIDKK